MCDNNDIKTKRKNYNVRVYTNFKHNRTPKDNEYSVCLSVTVLNSIFVNLDKKYYLQIFWEECKYAIKG